MVQRFNEEKFIGEVVNTGGSYYPAVYENLYKRHGGPINPKKLYKFESRFGKQYYITDTEVIEELEEMIKNEEASKIHDYLYALIIKRFGITMFLADVEHKIAAEREVGFREGKNHIQKEMRSLLGMAH